ncbi:MAG: hypothetical protein HY238_06125 [Acidobacteria bacterium]|nr:hypothetical protein [Acidobacteriota bacterium]
MMQRILVLLGLGGLLIPALPAQDTAELLAQMKAMEARLQALEAEVQALKAKPAAPAPTEAITVSTAPQEKSAEPLATSPQPTVGGLTNYSGPVMGNKLFNPEIAAIGIFRGVAGFGAPQFARDPASGLEMQESELSFQAIVDPYARADVFLSFGEHGVDLEEGYLTFSALPGALQLKTGKMRSAFGKINTMHLHVLPWIDRPLVTQNLINGEEGISDAGLSLSRILPAPGQVFLEATGQIFRGDSGDLFKSYRRSDVAAVGHLRGYRDITESTNLDLGASYARGHSPLGPSLVTEIYGMDATLRWKPLRRAIYHSFIARTEMVWGRARVSRPFGYYVSGEYQLNRRWLVGGRFDRSDRLSDSSLRDTGGSLLLTYRPTEFSQIRGQFRRTRYGEQATANEFLFQFMFSIGAHGAHPF